MKQNASAEDAYELESVAMDFTVPVSGEGMVDGLALAEKLFAKGLALILSYTRGCPSCAAAVMGVFGDRAFDAMMESWRTHHGVQSSALVFEDDPTRREQIILRATEAARERVRDLLQENVARGGHPACRH